MKYNKKALLKVVLVIAFVFVSIINSASFFAYASPAINFNKKGEIIINLEYKNKPISDAQLTIYKVADAKGSGDNLYFEYTNDFKDFSSTIDSLSQSDSSRKLARYVVKNKTQGISRKTDSKGYVKFSSLELGLYLVVQTKSVSGYSDCSPFIIYIPFEEDGQWLYTIDASPKTDNEPLTTKTTSPSDVTFDGGTTQPNHNDDNDFTTTTTNPYDFDDPYDDPDNPYDDPYDDDDNSSDTYDDNGKNTSTVDRGDTAEKELIKTGQNKMIVPILAVIGIIVFFFGLYLFIKDKKENNN